MVSIHGTLIRTRNNSFKPLAVILRASAQGKHDKYGNTPLHLLISAENVEYVRSLLLAGVNPERENYNGQTPLMRAAHVGSLEMTQILLDAGASIAASRTSPTQNTALTVALRRNHFDVFKFLLDKAIEKKVKIGLTDLFLWAAAHNRLPFVEYMISRNLSAVKHNTLAALNSAIRNGHYDMFKVLLKTKPDLNETYYFGYDNPLLLSVQAENLTMTKDLLTAGADPNVPKCKIDTLPPLIWAVQKQNLALTELLLEFGAKTQTEGQLFSTIKIALKDNRMDLVKCLAADALFQTMKLKYRYGFKQECGQFHYEDVSTFNQELDKLWIIALSGEQFHSYMSKKEFSDFKREVCTDANRKFKRWRAEIESTVDLLTSLGKLLSKKYIDEQLSHMAYELEQYHLRNYVPEFDFTEDRYGYNAQMFSGGHTKSKKKVAFSQKQESFAEKMEKVDPNRCVLM